uniref:Ig-like domain-containing protein n=1 Tax=Gasterosteus aculeatus aculeatus TaxID=481459 RepID=G3NI48_GASAC
MKRFLPSWVRTHLLLCLGLLRCDARVNTQVQAGPLYRVVGSPLSISCNVSGFFSDTAKKNFQFRFVNPPNPNEINIISTGDPNFSYTVYARRVGSKEITLTHVTPNSVLFKIQSLGKGDEGEYHCTVVNSEVVYDGTYSAETALKVIDNSLSVSSPASTPLSYNEGDAFTLTCHASTNTVQHTHLSLAWYLRKDDEDSAHPIISLDRDFTLNPGPRFKDRHQAGVIKLDKLGEATYKLNIAHLEPSDQGRIYCQAQQWIQDPDRSWYIIAQSDGKETTLNVKARDMSSLTVRISAPADTLQEGQELSLFCHVNFHDLQKRFFSVAWLRGNIELARVGPTGILSVGPEYSRREGDGELRAARKGEGEYCLTLQSVRTEDRGEYVCRARLLDRGPDGGFTERAVQHSDSQLVSISAPESALSVKMRNPGSVNEGYRLELSCEVLGVKGQLSVTWQRRSTTTAVFASVISLSQAGVAEKAEEFKSRKVSATRPATNTFTLELDEVRPSDSGVYQCAVTEWNINTKTQSQSQSATVTVTPAGEKYLLLSVMTNDSHQINEELKTRVQSCGNYFWIQGASTIDILTLYANGSISWSVNQQRYQLKVENKVTEVIYYLLINGASHEEAGNYTCLVSVFLEEIHRKLPASNHLGVEVQNPESKLVLTTTAAMSVNVNTGIEMKCSVVSKTSASSRYSVTWLLQQQGEKKTIVSSDQDALVTFDPKIVQSHRERIGVRRTKGPSFELSIQQVGISDKGSYTCEVVEWLQDPHGGWYQLSPVSKTTELTVSQPEKNLSVAKEDKLLNISRLQDFPIPCHITHQSSSESEFQVTWFWQKGTETEKRPLFTAYRNATLQDWVGKGDQLRFGHALQNRFSLTFLKPSPEDGGLYFCEVEEWLPSLSHGWRKHAVENSGYLTLHVYAEGDVKAVSEQQCLAIIWMGGFIVVLICSLLVIFLLLLVICKNKASGRQKPDQNLWAEVHPLQGKPIADD